MKNCRQTAKVGFLKTEPWKLEFSVFDFEVILVFENK